MKTHRSLGAAATRLWLANFVANVICSETFLSVRAFLNGARPRRTWSTRSRNILFICHFAYTMIKKNRENDGKPSGLPSTYSATYLVLVGSTRR